MRKGSEKKAESVVNAEAPQEVAKDVTEKKSDKKIADSVWTGRSSGDNVWAGRIVAVLCTVFGLILLFAETVAVITYLIPELSLVIFQFAGIGIESGLTIMEFSVGDMVVMCIVWLLPSLCMSALAVILQWKLIQWAFRKIVRIDKRMFARRKDSDKNQKDREESKS